MQFSPVAHSFDPIRYERTACCTFISVVYVLVHVLDFSSYQRSGHFTLLGDTYAQVEYFQSSILYYTFRLSEGVKA